jgi:hypothetical protein
MWVISTTRTPSSGNPASVMRHSLFVHPGD